MADETPPDLQRALDRLKCLHPWARMWGHVTVGAGRVEG
jgi:hypothetical protein